ncbi:hypothetical protein GGD56_004507 [Rhizobium mongolense]|uniref:Uncharacterized protein n=1 Tax=Rhizobium mongolense TaxID=57676 RepID=A0A7W6RQT3_9HYPH|nr:hypothetical protein [Rhizobium mongolense]MBB4276955.1 hypothetical protein [Rhizobium mongolense]
MKVPDGVRNADAGGLAHKERKLRSVSFRLALETIFA